MAGNCQFAFAVHILSVLALKENEGVTSDALAGSVNTNPVVIRRIVAVLQRAGLVTTLKGARGGVRLGDAPGRISLAVVYRAIGQASGFAGHRQKPNPCCPVGRKIELVLEEIFASAQSALEEALARRTIADVIETMTPKNEDGKTPGRRTAEIAEE